MTSRPACELATMISIFSSPLRGGAQVTCLSVDLPATALLAKPGPMLAATSASVHGAGNVREEPSGKKTLTCVLKVSLLQMGSFSAKKVYSSVTLCAIHRGQQICDEQEFHHDFEYPQPSTTNTHQFQTLETPSLHNPARTLSLLPQK